MGNYSILLINYIENWLKTDLSFEQYLQLRGAKCTDN